jgi:hypothetical protein
MTTIAGNLDFVPSGILAKLATVFFSLRGNACTGGVGAFVGRFVCHFHFSYRQFVIYRRGQYCPDSLMVAPIKAL